MQQQIVESGTRTKRRLHYSQGQSQDPSGIQPRLANEQHPRWNTDCLKRQEAAAARRAQASTSIKDFEDRKLVKLRKRDKTVDGVDAGRHRIGRRAANDETPVSNIGSSTSQVDNSSPTATSSIIPTDTTVPVESTSSAIAPSSTTSTAPSSSITTAPSNSKVAAAVNSTNMLCNGRADLCDLRYDQVTYPGTHNSAAYDLVYDCGLATETCLKSTTVCQAQSQNCTLGWETRCTKMTNTCTDKLPSWLHWLCGAFSSTCEATEQFCLGWEQICTSSVDVCELWGSACSQVIPGWAITCLWENQPGHTVAQQLSDGIRFLDLGTCLTRNNTDIVMCHGNGGLRAIGHTLDSILAQILDFMNANPYEVVTIEFNEYDGDVKLISEMIVKKILKTFTLASGELMFWPRKDVTQAWPTLRDMILANKRILLFFGDTYYQIPDPKPLWANQKDMWKQDGFQYAGADTTPAQLNQTYYDWCTQGPPKDGSYIRWQQMDINLAIEKDDILSSIKQGKIPQLCIGPLAVQTNSAMLDGLGDFCYGRWPYWFRVRVNDYWEGNVLKVANLFNDRNVARVKSGDQITPY